MLLFLLSPFLPLLISFFFIVPVTLQCILLQSAEEKRHTAGLKRTAPAGKDRDSKGLIQDSEELFQDLSQMQETWLAGGE